MRLNVAAKADPVFTHEGAPAAQHLTIEQKLRRSVLSCLLWESEFYEDGQSIADRIESLAAECPPSKLAALAVEARSDFHLRHVPLLLLACLAKTGAGTNLVSETIERTIQRADELTEFLAIYWRKGKSPLSKQVKLGLSRAFGKFNAYQLGKYDRANAIRLRDVLFLVHARPKDAEQEAVWKKLVANELESPDTWEVNLSGGADKKETFERLIRDGKLGYLALLRNLRNMTAGRLRYGAGARCHPGAQGRPSASCRSAMSRRRARARRWSRRSTRRCPKRSRLAGPAGQDGLLVDVSGSMR
jgi:60 kDa SS-A/Ro ribonucleoprotein